MYKPASYKTAAVTKLYQDAAVQQKCTNPIRKQIKVNSANAVQYTDKLGGANTKARRALNGWYLVRLTNKGRFEWH